MWSVKTRPKTSSPSGGRRPRFEARCKANGGEDIQPGYLAAVARANGTCCPGSEAEDAGADQVRQALALGVIEQRVQAPEGAAHGVAQPLCRRHPQLRRLLHARGVEGRAAHRVGEARQRAPPIDLALRPLGLQIVEDPSQLGHLLLVQLQLVGQEAQGTPDPERSTPEPLAFGLAAVFSAVAVVSAMAVATAPKSAGPMPSALGTPGPGATTTMTRAQPRPQYVVHFYSPVAEAISSRRVSRGRYASRV